MSTRALSFIMEKPGDFPRLQSQFFELLKRGELTMVTSWISFAEALVKPLQEGNATAEAGYRSFFTPSPSMEILPITKAIAAKAADLRARNGFKLPDALHIATGIEAGCNVYLTGDAQWQKTGLEVLTASSL